MDCDVLHAGDNYDAIVEISTMICQSMDYLLMQEKLKLYRPPSTFFPLKTAYRALKLGTPETSKHIVSGRKTIERLASKGFDITASFLGMIHWFSLRCGQS